MNRDGPGTAPWLLTFADLAALLLAFFVLTFAMSRLDVERWQALTTVWQGRTPTVTEPPRATSRIGHSATDPDPEPEAGRAAYLARVLDQRLAAVGRPYGLRAAVAGRSVILRFDRRLLTDRSSDTTSTPSRLRAILLPVLSGLVETRLEVPVPSELALVERLRLLRRLGDAAGRWMGHPPDRILAVGDGERAALVLVP